MQRLSNESSERDVRLCLKIISPALAMEVGKSSVIGVLERISLQPLSLLFRQQISSTFAWRSSSQFQGHCCVLHHILALKDMDLHDLRELSIVMRSFEKSYPLQEIHLPWCFGALS